MPGYETIEPGHPVTRYLDEKKRFSTKKNSVKPKAFEPTADLTLSVFRTLDLNETETWDLAVTWVEPSRKKLTLGRGDLRVSEFQTHGLIVEAFEPPPRHANVLGWPKDKEVRMSVMQEIAAAATLVLKGVPVA